MKRSISIFLFLLFLVSSCDQQKKPAQEKISFNDFFNNIKNSVSDSLLKRDFSLSISTERPLYFYSIDSMDIMINRENEILNDSDVTIIGGEFGVDKKKILSEATSYIELLKKCKVKAIRNNIDSGRIVFDFYVNALDTNTLPEFEFKKLSASFVVFQGDGVLLYNYNNKNFDSKNFYDLSNNWFLTYDK